MKKVDVYLNEDLGLQPFLLCGDRLAFKNGETKPYKVYKSCALHEYFASLGHIYAILDYEGNVIDKWHSMFFSRVNGMWEIVYKEDYEKAKIQLERFKHFK
jgi:hypothetical protein